MTVYCPECAHPAYNFEELDRHMNLHVIARGNSLIESHKEEMASLRKKIEEALEKLEMILVKIEETK